MRKTSAFPKLAGKKELVYSRFKGWTQEPQVSWALFSKYQCCEEVAGGDLSDLGLDKDNGFHYLVI